MRIRNIRRVLGAVVSIVFVVIVSLQGCSKVPTRFVDEGADQMHASTLGSANRRLHGLVNTNGFGNNTSKGERIVIPLTPPTQLCDTWEEGCTEDETCTQWQGCTSHWLCTEAIECIPTDWYTCERRSCDPFTESYTCDCPETEWYTCSCPPPTLATCWQYTCQCPPTTATVCPTHRWEETCDPDDPECQPCGIDTIKFSKGDPLPPPNGWEW